MELFLTLAVLMILLGLMINLSNRVRRESADKATRKVLAQLTVMMAQYRRANSDSLPPVAELVDEAGGMPGGSFGGGLGAINESTIQANAVRNSSDFVRYLKLQTAQSDKSEMGELFKESLVNDVLQDPWGSPIVFMPSQNPAIGMAPGDAFFFFSAGPDRQFLTREDNVYSYEQSGNLPSNVQRN